MNVSPFCQENLRVVNSGWDLSRAFPIIIPLIKSGKIYHFTTPSGLLYEVRFGSKSDDLLSFRINFSVLGEEFESEYDLTNRGEAFGIVATVTKILVLFFEQNQRTRSFEFSGEYKDDEKQEGASIRTKMYYRYVLRCIDQNWNVNLDGNKVVIACNLNKIN